MENFHRTALLGQPGSGKSTVGLSHPGVEQHVWGSSEEDSAINFSGRSDILPPVKMDWFDCLTDVEKDKFVSDKTLETEIARITKVARAKNVTRYRRYLYSIKRDILAGKRKELKTIFLDNGTPFSNEFQDYVEIIYSSEFMTDKGNFNSIKFSIKYQTEFTDFLRLFYSLPCHTIMSFHIAMTLDEETASKADFMKDTQKGIKYPKEWQPMIYGKAKYVLAGIPTWAFYLWAEESAGKKNEYYGKLEADSSNVGIAKSRVQPFEKPSRIKIPQNTFYDFLSDALKSKFSNTRPNMAQTAVNK